MSFFDPESTSSATENIDGILRDNMERAHGERIDREGSIGPTPSRYQFPGGLTEEDLLDMVTGGYGGITKTGGSVLSKLAKGIKGSKLGKKAIGAVKRKLNTSKAYQSWMKGTTPSKQLAEIGEESRALAMKDMTGKEGFKRFLYTVDAPKEFATKKMHRAFQGLIRPGMKAAKFGKMSRQDKLFDVKTAGGYATPANSISPAEVRVREFGPLLRGLFGGKQGAREYMKSTGVHEFTHVAQKPLGTRYPGVAYMDKFAKQYKLNPKQARFLEDAFWPTADNPSTFWKYKYAEKMKPFARKQYDIMDKDVITKINKSTGPDKWKYYLSPHEISARAASMRNLIDETNPRILKKGGELWRTKDRLLKEEMGREIPYMDLKGSEMAINKLWGLGPVGLAIDQHIADDKDK